MRGDIVLGQTRYRRVPELDHLEEQTVAEAGRPVVGDRTYQRIVGGKSVGTIRLVIRLHEKMADIHAEIRGDVPEVEVRDLVGALHRTMADIGGVPIVERITPLEEERAN